MAVVAAVATPDVDDEEVWTICVGVVGRGSVPVIGVSVGVL